jgi:hypothetical protein
MVFNRPKAEKESVAGSVPRTQHDFANDPGRLNWQAPGRVTEKYAPLAGTRHAGAAAPG